MDPNTENKPLETQAKAVKGGNRSRCPRRRTYDCYDGNQKYQPTVPPTLSRRRYLNPIDDLIDGPYWAALTTVMPDGQPQTTPVWCNREGNYVLTNTMRGFRKEKNMRANPHVTLLVYDPRNPQRNIEVRGLVVAMSEAGRGGA